MIFDKSSWVLIKFFFSKLPPYFELKLEVYSYLLTEPVTSAHAKLVRTINKAVGSIQKVLKEHNEEVGLSFIHYMYCTMLIVKYPYLSRQQNVKSYFLSMLAKGKMNVEKSMRTIIKNKHVLFYCLLPISN